MNEQNDLTAEEIDQLNGEAEIAEMKAAYNERMAWVEGNGYEERGEGIECPGNNGGHNVKLWHNPKTRDTISVCSICEHIDG